MAIVNRSSGFITNADATPPTKTDSIIRGIERATIGVITPAADDTAGSVGRLLRVSSNVRVSAVSLTCAAFTTAGAADVGVYRTPGDGGAVVDADFFASAQVLTAALADASILNESTVNTLANQLLPLWQAVGLASDPGGELDIAYTITTTFIGGQAILAKCRFVM